jgi:hypothetical protein
MSKRERAQFGEYDEGVNTIYVYDEAPKIEVRGTIGALILCLQTDQGDKFWIEMDDFYAAHLANDIIEMTRSVDEYNEDGDLT